MAPDEDRADARRLAVLRSRRDRGEGESRRSRDAGACTGARAGRAPAARLVRGGRRAGARCAAGADGHDRKARRRPLPAHDRRRQLRLADRRVQGPHHDARGRHSPRRARSPTSPKRRSCSRTSRSATSMNTHPHSDHTGGLPALVAEGATIITQKNNEEFFERALNTPRTLLTDTLAKNPKKAKVEACRREEGLLGRHADGRDVPHLPGAALERAAGRVHPEGEGAVPGRLLAARPPGSRRTITSRRWCRRSRSSISTSIATSTCTRPRRRRRRRMSRRR